MTKTPATWNHFTISEFACPCCGADQIEHLLIELLDKARSRTQIPFIITSGFRCPDHNRFVGGSPTSSHLLGLAADIQCHSPSDRFEIIRALISVGFRRIIVYSDRPSIHVDIDLRKAHPLILIGGHDTTKPFQPHK